MDLKLKDKVVVVTGGSAGIGLETCRLFAQEGARVVIASRREDALAKAAAGILKDTGTTVDTISIDVTKVEDLDTLVKYVKDTYGRIDILVNNAGTGTYKPFLEVTDEELTHGMAINFFAQFRLTQRFTPMMIEQHFGVVINVAGETGIKVMPPPFRSSCTGPAKSAEIRLSKVLATELGEHNIRVNCVVPGLVYTDERFDKWEREMAKTELDDEAAKATRKEWGRNIARPDHEWGTAEELGNLIVFAASDRSTFINGAVLVADGGEDKS
jgi:NAD(P)-dependent dehydrogenase (short-subunit alcohol dehydrogenase family)